MKIPKIRWLAVLALTALVLPACGSGQPARVASPLDKINHIVVIYQENHSFDNYLGNFPGADGIAQAGAAAVQTDKEGRPYAKLPPAPANQEDGNRHAE